MQYRKTLLSVCLLPILFAAGCGADNHSAQDGSSLSQSSSKKGINAMPNLNLMLNEIFAIRITDISSQRANVSHIVSKYIHSGISRYEVNELVSNEFDILENSNNKLVIHYKKGEGSLGNRRDLYISLFFDGDGKLLNNSSFIDKSNNL